MTNGLISQLTRMMSFGTAVALLATVAISITASPLNAATTTPVKLFGTKEKSSTKLEKFTKWGETLDRYLKEEPSELNKCQPSAVEKCHITRWRIFLKQIAKKTPSEQLAMVNTYVNKWLYKVDPRVYRKKDYWATPAQFFNKSGDCEDYAITKYISLSHLGFDKDKMRIAIVQDLNLKVPHAVLVVYFDGKALILDNQIKQVVSASRITHYKPIYSINETKWWIHK
jgi:predicted transglutaminase-like cysteine proteinase